MPHIFKQTGTFTFLCACLGRGRGIWQCVTISLHSGFLITCTVEKAVLACKKLSLVCLSGPQTQSSGVLTNQSWKQMPSHDSKKERLLI